MFPVISKPAAAAILHDRLWMSASDPKQTFRLCQSGVNMIGWGKKLTVILSMLLMLNFLTGCATAEWYQISKPYLTDGTEIKKGIIETVSYRLVVRAANYASITEPRVVPLSPSIAKRESKFFSSPYYYYNKELQNGKRESVFRNKDIFFIDIAITPKKKLMKIEPQGFFLEIDGQMLKGEVYGPTHYRENMVTSFNAPVWGLCDYKKTDSYVVGVPDDYLPKEEHKLSQPQTLESNGEYCFTLKFDMAPPDPETTSFVLHLNALNLDDVTALKFKPDSLLR